MTTGYYLLAAVDPDPLRNNVMPWLALRERARGMGRFGWVKASLSPPRERAEVAPSSAPVSPTLAVAVGLAVVIAGTLGLLATSDDLPFALKLAAGGVIVGVMSWIGAALRGPRPQRSDISTRTARKPPSGLGSTCAVPVTPSTS